MSWLELAESLPIGTHTKFKCINACGSDRSMIVNHSHKEYSAYCFRCGKIGYQNKGYQTLQQLEKIRELDRLAKDASTCVNLPKDTIFDFERFSSEARMWLLSASISGVLTSRFGIGYSPKLQRVVLPVFRRGSSGELIFYQLRRLIGKGPKYISPSVDRSSIFYFSAPDGSSLDEVIVVEDILSAIRVGQRMPAVSLLGTSISTQQAAYLSRFKLVTTWMDPDKAGIAGAASIRRACALTSDVRNITSEKDPKLLSNRQILEHLK